MITPTESEIDFSEDAEGEYGEWDDDVEDVELDDAGDRDADPDDVSEA